MTKRHIKITLLLIILLFVLPECKTGNNEKNQPPAADIQMDITEKNTDIVIYKSKRNEMNMSGLQLRTWEDYIDRKYDLNKVLEIIATARARHDGTKHMQCS